MGLRERMAQAAARKDMKRAERQSMKTLTSGAQLANELARGRALDLDKMKVAVQLFVDGGENLDAIKQKLGAKHQGMLLLVESELKGDWAQHFVKLAAAVPLVSRRLAHQLTWTQWREIGLSVGMPEEQVVDALRVMIVFRNR